jgi:hypothetical protein
MIIISNGKFFYARDNLIILSITSFFQNNITKNDAKKEKSLYCRGNNRTIHKIIEKHSS